MPITTILVPPGRGSGTFSAEMYALFSAINLWAEEANAMEATIEPVEKWMSETTYAEGKLVWSPANYKVYRRKTAGGGTTDPSQDPANWVEQYTTLPDPTGQDGKVLGVESDAYALIDAAGASMVSSAATSTFSTSSTSWQTLSSPSVTVTALEDNPSILLITNVPIRNNDGALDFRREISGGSSTDNISGAGHGVAIIYTGFPMLVDMPSVSKGYEITYKINYKSKVSHSASFGGGSNWKWTLLAIQIK